MSRETRYAGALGSLGRFHTALKANSQDLAHLEGPRSRLETILTGAEESAKEQSALTGAKQEATKRLRASLTEGQRVANGLRKLVIEHYGVRSEKLAEFGLQPFRGRSRKSQPQETTPPESTPAAAGPAEAAKADR